MALTATTQAIIDWGRFSVPDPKTRNNSVRKLELGRTTLATGSRETFTLKHSPTGSVFIYVEPHRYSTSATLTGATTNTKVYLWASATLTITFPNGSSDPSTRPAQFKAVLADYEYNEDLPYSYSDTELTEFLPAAIEYINNTFEKSFSYTGTISTFVPTYSNTQDKALIAKALAITVRRSYLEEQKRRGLGIRFRGPGQSIDTIAQMKDYQFTTDSLIKELMKQVQDAKIAAVGGAEVIDVYAELVVTG